MGIIRFDSVLFVSVKEDKKLSASLPSERREVTMRYSGHYPSRDKPRQFPRSSINAFSVVIKALQLSWWNEPCRSYILGSNEKTTLRTVSKHDCYLLQIGKSPKPRNYPISLKQTLPQTHGGGWRQPIQIQSSHFKRKAFAARQMALSSVAFRRITKPRPTFLCTVSSFLYNDNPRKKESYFESGSLIYISPWLEMITNKRILKYLSISSLFKVDYVTPQFHNFWQFC